MSCTNSGHCLSLSRYGTAVGSTAPAQVSVPQLHRPSFPLQVHTFPAWQTREPPEYVEPPYVHSLSELPQLSA